jgi:hypothetical protein
MTGLEPHPVFRLPTQEEARAMGPDRFAGVIRERARRMELEIDDPLAHGFEPPIWRLIDDLLVEGKRVCLVDYPQLLPKDWTKSQAPQIELVGRRELFVSGANGASKSEYAAKKLSKILRNIENALCWAFHETEKESIDRQQPLFVRYLPPAIRRQVMATGRFKQGAIANVSWTQKNGFTEKSFVLPNGSQQTFKFYKQEEQTVEGAQVHAIWADELVPLELVSTLRFRLMKHKGILLVTFTPIRGWTPTYQEYAEGMRLVLEVEALRLPVKKPRGKNAELGTRNAERGTEKEEESATADSSGGEFEIVGYEKVPRLGIAGPGSDGNLKANIVWMQSDDNVFLDKKELDERLRGATRQLILERGYGVATRAFANAFPKFSQAVHVIAPERVPKEGSNYHVVDPCDGRNWFMLWIRIDALGRWFVYREWPSYGHPEAYIPAVGELGPWTLPGAAADGKRGPGQDALGWSLSRYITEIERLEGKKQREAAAGFDARSVSLKVTRPQRPGLQKRADNGERISDRWMDSRYGNRPTQSKEHYTTLIEQMSDLDMEFRAASGDQIGEGVTLINDALDYDDTIGPGKYSAVLSRINEPKLFISRNCPNTIYALQNWTGKDGQHGACKDPVDCLRYGLKAELIYIGNEEAAFVRARA